MTILKSAHSRIRRVTADLTEINKELPMLHQERKAIIQEIVDECNHEETERGRNRILMKWRAKLEKEPPRLPPFQIDDIIREARRKLSKLSQ